MKEMVKLLYVKKPVVVEAMKFERCRIAEIKTFCEDRIVITIPRCLNGIMTGVIKTLEGDMKASEGDYIIKGVKGEFYPCREDIFHETYALADTETMLKHMREKGVL